MEEDIKLEWFNNKLYCTKNGLPYFAKLVRYKEQFYYIGEQGFALTGKIFLHTADTNGLIYRGIYKFRKDGSMVKDYYKMPSDMKHHHHHSHKHSNNSHHKSKIKFGKKERNAVLIVCSILLIGVLVPIISITLTSKADTPTIQDSEKLNNIYIECETFKDKTVYLTSQKVTDYYDGKSGPVYVGANGAAVPVVLNYSIDLLKNTSIRKSDIIINLRLSDYEDFREFKKYSGDPNETSILLPNLKVNNHYFYDVTFIYPTGEKTFAGSFYTAETDRYLNIDGIGNIRDFGGRTNLDGVVTKQNQLILGSELDGLTYPRCILTAEGLEQFNDLIKFTSEIDLRNSSVYSYDYVSKLGKSVSHKFYNGPTNSQIFNASYKNSICDIFSSLANKNNYPVYMHCSNGCVNTASITYLLGAVLNLSNEVKLQQYETSCFAISSVESSGLNPIIYGFDAQSSSSKDTNTHIVDWLVNTIGVPQSNINSIREIFLNK